MERQYESMYLWKINARENLLVSGDGLPLVTRVHTLNNKIKYLYDENKYRNLQHRLLNPIVYERKWPDFILMIQALLQHFSIKIKHCMLWFFKETFYAIECINVQLCWWISINHNINKTERSWYAVACYPHMCFIISKFHFTQFRLKCVWNEWLSDLLLAPSFLCIEVQKRSFYLFGSIYPFHSFSLYMISNDQAAYNLFILYFRAFTAVSLSLHALRC